MRLALVDYTTGHIALDTAAGPCPLTLEAAKEALAGRKALAFAGSFTVRDDIETFALYAGIAADLNKPDYEFRAFDFHRGQDYPSANGGYSVFRLDVPGCAHMEPIADGTDEQVSRDVQIFGEWLGFVAPAAP